ncbi:uncharacterized protein PV09_08882 [Verruconis gallopava]|uniref:superoxide dismutase n=1 Tax=Verruconis gallopava TaxID=253628 RepID=A0A0D1YFC2_9PEZI|nr:uncharacterized protein PV09_08882 [Verruconis gallopava]KIV99456.1 hypothetical protein PV09_08882 [Verruconis gallopava]
MRRLISITSCLNLVLLGPSNAWATDAPVVENNPQNVQYVAEFSKNGLIGRIVANTPSAAPGVAFDISITGNATFDSSDYLYHIHEQPVPADGNCSATLAHLDPYGRGETPPCNANDPASCQVGDLSGKHGTIPHLPGFSASYVDNYISLTPGTPAFMGNRSFVLHFSNKTRITCANFKLVDLPAASNVTDTASCSPTGCGSSTAASQTLASTVTGVFTTVSSTVHSATTASSTGGGLMASSDAQKMNPRIPGAIALGPLVFCVAAAVW